MSNLSYSHKRQAILFKAARETRKVACEYLDDVTEAAEFMGTTAAWAKAYAAMTAQHAARLEDDGYEIAYATSLNDTLNFKSKRAYSKSVDEFEKRAISFGVDPASIDRRQT